MKSTILTFILLLLGVHTAKATHLMGADMHYTYLGNSKYRITAKLYRDCRGIALANPLFRVSAGTASGTSCGSYTLPIKLRSIRDITPICKIQPKPCNPSNTELTGEGVEEHTYDTIVDFSVAPLSNFVGKSSCGEVTFFIGQCCRNTSITTGPAGQDFWASCTINLNNLAAISSTATNNSPRFSNYPIIFTCCNQPYRYNNGSIDSLEQDSMSFKMVPGLIDLLGASVKYFSPFTYRYPLTPKCSTPGKVNCAPDPTAKPPIGIFLDTGNGDLVFTPVNCVEAAVLALEVTEYRKTPGGSWVWIGKARRDVQMIIKNDCANNNPPEISGVTKITACPGDSICYRYVATDVQALPEQKKADTITMSWNRGIPGASFRLKDSSAREKEALFCWKIPQEAEGKTYSFTITAEDEACPRISRTIQGVRIFVCNKSAAARLAAKPSLRIYPQPCSVGQPLMGLAKDVSWEWLDMNGRKCGSGKGAQTLLAPDRPGMYLIRSGNATALVQVLP